MQLETYKEKPILQIFAGPLLFILLFLFVAIMVAFFIPQGLELSQINSIYALPSWENTEPGKRALLIGKPIEEALQPHTVQSEIVKKSANTDFALEMYRQLLTRNAVISFYETITSNRDVALAVLEYADVYNIPVGLAFSLAYNESRYKTRAVNGNTNASIDRGLFQLNSASFPSFTEEDFFNPYVSAKQGLAFLRYCLDIGGNEISALAMYNAGTARVRNNNTPQMTLNHISNIVTYQKGLENLFNTKVVSSFSSENRKLLALSGIIN